MARGGPDGAVGGEVLPGAARSGRHRGEGRSGQCSQWAWLALPALLIAAAGCGGRDRQPILMAAGSYGDIAVCLSSAGLEPAVAPGLARFNPPVTFVIKDEPTYKIDVFAGDDWRFGRDYKNLLLLVNWADGGPVVKALEKLLPEAERQRLRAGGGGLAQFNDPFAGDQFAVLVAAGDRNTLASLLNRNAERLQGLFETSAHERLRRQQAREGIHDSLVTKYWREHRFLISLPLAYRVSQDQPGGFPGVEWTRTGPTRGLTLAWEHADDPAAALADRDRLLALRRRLGERMHKETIDDQVLEWSPTRLGELPAVRLTGAWNGAGVEGGGPFWSYFVADPEGRRVFCLDLLAYAPGMDKMPLFREMLAVAETFALRQPQP